jgi:phosphohistidine phosphatase
MKTLYLLRHAKSSRDDPELKDLERPLADRGLRDILKMASRFQQRGDTVDCVVTSPALRAKTTAKILAGQIGFPPDEVATNPEFYFAGAGMFVKAVSLLDVNCQSAMLVGHNPTITEFADRICDGRIDHIPTCGLLKLQFPVQHWEEIQEVLGELVYFDYPKKED